MATTTTELSTLEVNHEQHASSSQPTSSTGSQTASPVLLPLEVSPTSTLCKGRSIIVVALLSGEGFLNSFSNGLIVVALPSIATDLALAENLLVWPTSVSSLTSGTCVLIAGAVADVLGPRSMNLVGCLLMACFMLACGVSKTGIELIMFRAMQGIANALTVPTAISIVSTSITDGKPRNLGFAFLGLCQPLGFSVGLVASGVLVDTIGWRTGFYLGGGLSFLLFVAGIWALPPIATEYSGQSKLQSLRQHVDWVGAGMVSTALALFSYVLAMLSADIDSIKQGINIVLLTLSVGLVVAFVYWVAQREKQGKTALLPNSIWKKTAFTSICVMVLLAYAVQNSLELYSSLFFQEIQSTSALGASIRLLPNLLMGVLMNLVTGLIINQIPAVHAVLISSALCAVSPLLMALINPSWPYWYDAFFAQLLAPLSGDVLFTVGLLIVSASFPARTQGLAGAAFNTFAQLGQSIGLTLLSVISTAVTKDSRMLDKESPRALMEGYRASFWALFAMMMVACVIGGVGLRKVGRIGEKRD